MQQFMLSVFFTVFLAMAFFAGAPPLFLSAQILVPPLPARTDLPPDLPPPPDERDREKPYMPTVEIPETKKWPDSKSNDIEICNLQCENLIDPLAVSTTVPKLSWKIRSKNNIADQKQTEYHIIVAKSEFELLNNQGSIWNSGYVESGNSEILYSGLKLGSGNGIFYWKVRVLDKEGKSSEWSPPARFAVGLLNESDWKGEWLKFSPTEHKVCFSKHLTLQDKPQTALTYILSNSDHELYINGKKAESPGRQPKINVALLAYRILLNCPCESSFLFEPYCAAYNAAPLLQQGDNHILIRCETICPSAGRAVLLQMNGKTVRNANFTLHTDNTWNRSAQCY
ncbi:MAG: hypothetical protein LBH00_10135 [Planctomycetaceae bacterium]|jgi:hypothetical protein|nr:hypothetical protein [Planctomycetaceae bacterium]